MKDLFQLFKKPLSGDNTLIYALESPKYDNLKLDDRNIFSGCVFNCTDKDIREITVSSDGHYIGSFPVNIPRDDIAKYVPHIKSAKNCGFSFQLHIDSKLKYYDFLATYADGCREPLFRYDVSFVLREYRRLREMNIALEKLPMPDANLVYTTQGSYDVVGYRNSIISGIYTMKSYLELAGVNLNSINNVLDFGCGTGRMLLGFYLYCPDIRLFGCDINRDLIDWAKQNLPQDIDFRQNFIAPPLPYAGKQFDFIYLISVFTHLSLATQRLWVQELQRVIKVKGYILLTVQGETYLSLSGQSEGIHYLRRDGYLEKQAKDEGSNDFGTYHTYSFIKRLFGDNFRICGFFPNGRIENNRILFPIAAFQDVYVLQCMRDATRSRRLSNFFISQPK